MRVSQGEVQTIMSDQGRTTSRSETLFLALFARSLSSRFSSTTSPGSAVFAVASSVLLAQPHPTRIMQVTVQALVVQHKGALAGQTRPTNPSHAWRIARDAASRDRAMQVEWMVYMTSEFSTTARMATSRFTSSSETSPHRRLTSKRSHGPCTRYAWP